MPVQRVPRQPGLDSAKPVRYRRLPVPDVSTGGGGGPTFIITDVIGFKDAETWAWNLPDAIGLKDAATTWGLNPTDKIGLIDALALVGTPVFADRIGFKDALVLVIDENIQLRSGTPDSDKWGDAWVNRTVGQTGVNHGNEPTLQVAALTALTQQDGYLKIDFTRFAGLAATGTSTLQFTFTWPVVALSPNQNLLVNFRSSAGSPFTESTITAANKARFASSAPYTQRTFTFASDGSQRTLSVTFTSAEVNDFLGKWLEVQFTTPDLSVGTLVGGYQRESGLGAGTLPSYHLELAKA